MKNRKRILSLYGIFIKLVFLLSACEDNIVSFIDDRGNNTITGKVVDAYGVPLAGIKVELANVVVPNFTYSDAGGNFILDSVKKPYDIAGILRDSVMFGDRSANVFIGVTASNPVLTISKTISSKSSGLITVNFPDTNTNPNHKYAFIFWDSLGINHIFQLLNPGIPLQTGKFWFTDGNLKGKAAILGYYTEGYRIISYDKYGEKPLTINQNENVDITFTQNEIRTNPDEIQMNYSFINATGVTINSKSVGVSQSSFFNFDNAGNIFPSDYQLTTNSIILPSIAGINFNYYVKIGYKRLSDNAAGYITYRLVNGGIYATLNPPSCNYPLQGATGVLPSTEFSMTTENNSGVNVFLRNKYSSYELPIKVYIYTTKTSVVYPRLSDDIFNLKINTQYAWGAERFDDVNSMEQLLSQAININPYLKNSNYNFDSRSFYSGNW
jgi:hypothetical protein